MYDLCEFEGFLHGAEFSAPLLIRFTGTSLECDMNSQDVKRFHKAYPASVEEKKLTNFKSNWPCAQWRK